ncbi:MAG: hypothetical protein JWO50_355 [Candidatus Kaiserbacteria bacterium]|nr:hypothetical protein [Candidatus Kaiserbacteria bacterium]
MKRRHTLQAYITQAYRRRHEPESIRILAEVYWWGILSLGLIIVLLSGWVALTTLITTLDTIDNGNTSPTDSVEKITGINPDNLHTIIMSVLHRDESGIDTVPAVADPAL